MKLSLLCGSPKLKSSASEAILHDLSACVGGRARSPIYPLHTAFLSDEKIADISGGDAVVLSFPLYVDGVPSHLLTCLEQLARAGELRPETGVYAVVNCGFFEGAQCEPALEMIENWCLRCGIAWRGGLGVGGGGGLTMMSAVPPGVGPKKTLGEKLHALANAAIAGTAFENEYFSVDFPAFLYKLAAQSGWRRAAKANGLKPKDLARRP